jgi:hypothetical protein
MADFTNTTKVPDRARPIHRINSPSYDENRLPPSGRGQDCGCRDATHFQGMPAALLKLARTVPDWVPVEREGKPPSVTREMWATLPEVEYELEGAVTDSRHARIDVPFTQWHFWYDWNFFVIPAKGFEYLRGRGNPHQSIECEWDVGAFGDYDFQSSRPTPAVPGPMFDRDWAWPVGGEYMWIAGRWIYDCGHPQSRIFKKDGGELLGDITKERSEEVFVRTEGGFLRPSTVKHITIATATGPVTVADAEIDRIERESIVHTELHPCKAVASARWEAVKFDDNERHVPAIQFMFFACLDGGYISPFPLNSRDYEFIVDLPESAEDKGPYPVGHAPEFPMNTLVVRPRLLVQLDYAPFASARRPVVPAGQADPVIELLPAEKGGVPKQVKIRVPLTKVDASAHSYGVIVSLGWHDPERKQANKVKRVIVFLDSLEVGPAFPFVREHEGSEAWEMKIGVNGRWFAKTSNVTRQGMLVPLQKTIELHLAEEDHIAIKVFGIGATFHAEMFSRGLEFRILGTEGLGAGRKYRWEEIDQPDDDRAAEIINVLTAEGIQTLFAEGSRLDAENIGRQQISPGRPVATGDSPNPMTLKELMSRMGAPGRPMRGKLTAARSTGSGIGPPDYVLHYEIKYEDLLS